MADELDLFVDGLEPAKLFEVLRDQCQPGHPWPILYITGPYGAGKTTLTKHLYRGMHHSIFPHIRINFQREDISRQPLQILVKIRDEFHRHTDAHGSSLRFPLFDFGAALIRGAQEQGNAVLSDDEAVDRISRNSAILDRWMEPTGALGNQITIVPSLMIVLKSALDFEPISRFMQSLREGVIWGWYKKQALRLGLRPDQDIKVLMERLYELAREGDSDELLEELLVEALFADLAAAFTPKDPELPHPWPDAHRAVVFFDNFDVLINASTGAERILELLVLHMPVQKGAPTLLLLVVASELPLYGTPLPVRQPIRHDESEMLHYAQGRFNDWFRTLPRPYSKARLRDLIWPVELHSFNLAETQSYLLGYGKKHNLLNFEEDEQLVDHVHKLTYGYPLCVRLVARATQRMGHLRYTDNLENLSSENKTIADDLYEHFMQSFDQQFQEELILCALPLALNKEVLELLEHRTYVQLQRFWSILQRLPFTRIRQDGSIIFHPLVRRLLLMHFTPEAINRNYHQYHDRLQQYFEHHSTQSSEFMLARTYHTLLQGKVEAALELGRQLFQSDRNRWRELLKTIDDIPFGPGYFVVDRSQIGQMAEQSLVRLQTTANSNDGADAILLYRWLLTEPLTEEQKENCLYGLASCYTRLTGAVSQEDITETVHHMVRLRDRRVRVQANTHSGVATTTPPVSTIPPEPARIPPAGRVAGDNGQRTNGAAAGFIHRGAPPVSQQRSQASGLPLLPTSPLPGATPTSARPWIGIRRLFARLQRRRPWNRTIIPLLTIFFVIMALIFCPILPNMVQNEVIALLPHPATPTPILVTNPPTPSLLGPDKNGMGVTVQENNEYTGLSNGSFPFDIAGRPDSLHKTLASNAFLHGDAKSAIVLWNKAIGSSASSKDNDDEPNDAEVQIYLQNQIVADRCIGIVIATDLSRNTGSGVTVGRDELQGAYLVQRAQNDSPDKLKVCLYIANMGNDPRNANGVVQQIVQAVPKYRIKAVVGWPTIDGSRDALQTLYNARIPVISADAYQHQRDVLPNLFHVIPSNEVEGQQDAFYVEHSSQSQRVVILSSANEQSDSYSAGLKNGFLQQLHHDGMDDLVVDRHQYKGNDFAAIMKQVALKKPDLIYFTGGIDDAIIMLANLTPGQFSDRLRVLGGHKLYQLVGYSGLQPSGIQYLDFSAGGYPDEGSVLTMKQHYAEYFDKGDTNSAAPRVYGYSRPDNDVICSYNAMNVLFVALHSFGSSSQFQPAQLIEALKQNSLQLIGTSQKATTTTFNEFNEPAKPDLLIVHVDKDLHLQANSLVF